MKVNVVVRPCVARGGQWLALAPDPGHCRRPPWPGPRSTGYVARNKLRVTREWDTWHLVRTDIRYDTWVIGILGMGRGTGHGSLEHGERGKSRGTEVRGKWKGIRVWSTGLDFGVRDTQP